VFACALDDQPVSHPPMLCARPDSSNVAFMTVVDDTYTGHVVTRTAAGRGGGTTIVQATIATISIVQKPKKMDDGRWTARREPSPSDRRWAIAAAARAPLDVAIAMDDGPAAGAAMTIVPPQTRRDSDGRWGGRARRAQRWSTFCGVCYQGR
jgi:hypothetical protein